MKTSLQNQVLLLLLVGGVLLPSIPANAIDLPRPSKVVREVRGLVHRAAGELKGNGRSAPSRYKSKSAPSKASKANKADSPVPAAMERSGDSGVLPPPVDQSPSSPDLAKPASRIEKDMQSTPGAIGKSASPSTGGIPLDVGVRPTPTAPASEKENVSSKLGSDPDSFLKTPDLAVPNQQVEFARPVPGKAGLVYPPGVEESAANMVDVDGMTPGRLARDPRTGKIFRVP